MTLKIKKPQNHSERALNFGGYVTLLVKAKPLMLCLMEMYT